MYHTLHYLYDTYNTFYTRASSHVAHITFFCVTSHVSCVYHAFSIYIVMYIYIAQIAHVISVWHMLHRKVTLSHVLWNLLYTFSMQHIFIYDIHYKWHSNVTLSSHVTHMPHVISRVKICYTLSMQHTNFKCHTFSSCVAPIPSDTYFSLRRTNFQCHKFIIHYSHATCVCDTHSWVALHIILHV